MIRSIVAWTLLAFVICVGRGVGAEVLRVAAEGGDGSLLLADALHLAQPGDVVELATGRYESAHPVVYPGVTIHAMGEVKVSQLTIRAAHGAAPVIGPESQDMNLAGLALQLGVSEVRIEGIRFENLAEGVWLLGNATVENCHFEGNRAGVLTFLENGGLVAHCEFVNNEDGCVVGPTTRGVVFRDSTFRDNDTSIVTSTAHDVRVERCVVRGGRNGFNFGVNSSATVQSCDLRGTANVGLFVGGGSTAEVEDSEIRSVTVAIEAHGFAEARFNRCRLDAENFAVAKVVGAVSGLRVNNCEIGQGSTWTVFTGNKVSPPVVDIDFTANYWQTTDPIEIAESILDRQDDPSNYVRVVFESIADGSVANRTRSWGDFKSRY